MQEGIFMKFIIFLNYSIKHRYTHNRNLVVICCMNSDMKFPLSSVQFSHSVVSNSLWPHGLQHARLPCPSPTPGAYSNSCPSHWWCHPTISSSIIPFSSHLQSFSASGSFPVNQFFASGGQSTEVSALASVLPMDIQDWFPLEWTGWISLQSKGLSKSLLQHHSSKASIFWHSVFMLQLSHPYMTTGKAIALSRWTICFISSVQFSIVQLSYFKSWKMMLSKCCT